MMIVMIRSSRLDMASSSILATVTSLQHAASSFEYNEKKNIVQSSLKLRY